MNTNDMLCLDGSNQKVYTELCSYGFECSDDVERILTFLNQNKQILKDGEEIKYYQVMPKKTQGMIGLVIINHNIYVNLKCSTILLTALFLDIKVANGFAALLVNMMGIPENVIVKFDEYHGEKCIIHEAMIKKTISVNVLDRYNGECCNNHYKCRYNIEGKCKCTHAKIQEILDQFTKVNMFKEGDGLYTLQW